MVEMKKYKLGDVCLKITDGSHFSPKAVDFGYPMYSVKDMNEFGFNDSDYKMISEDDFKSLVAVGCRPQKDDVLIAKDGSYLKYAFVCKEEKDEVILSSIAILRPNKDIIDSTFFSFLLRNPFVKKSMKYYVSGTALPRIVLDNFKKMEINIPGLSEQKKIGDVLSDFDKRIENLRAQNRVLEQTAKTIYDYTFLQCAGHQTTYNKTLNRNIPADWEVKSVNQMAKSYRGVAYDKSDVQKENNGGILVLRGNNIQDNNLVYDGNVVYIPENLVEDNQHIKKGDIIMTMSSGSKEHIGKCTMFQYDSKHTYGAFLTKFTPNRECRYYFYMNLISDYFKAKIKSVCNGTGINNLTNQTFNEIFFPYPDSKTLDVFEKTVTPIFNKMGVNTKQIEALTTQRNTLLPLLMTGQIEV